MGELPFAAAAGRTHAAQVLLQRRGLRLNPVTALYYIAPCCLGFLTVPWAALEAPRLLAVARTVALDAPLILASAVAAFALNLSVSGDVLSSQVDLNMPFDGSAKMPG